VIWEFGDIDPQKEAQLYEVRGRTDMTRNEIRLAQGLLPMGFWVEPEKIETLSDEDRDAYESNLWNQPTDPGFVNAFAQAKQMEQYAAQGGEGGEPGAEGQPGMPPGAGGDFPDQEGDGAPFGPGPEAMAQPGQGDDDGTPPYGQVPEAMTKARRRRGRTTIYVHDE
jgi:hypothetical protein